MIFIFPFPRVAFVLISFAAAHEIVMILLLPAALCGPHGIRTTVAIGIGTVHSRILVSRIERNTACRFLSVTTMSTKRSGR